MRNLSSAFQDELNNDNRYYLEWVDITLADGTVLNLTNKDIWNYGIKIEDSVSGTSEFQIGAAIVNKATVSLNNIYDDFTDYLFDGAEIVIHVGLVVNIPDRVRWCDVNGELILDSNGEYIYTTLSPTSVEKIRVFTGTVVETPTTNSSILTLTCYDNMNKFDKDYSESKLEYPATRSQIIRDACEVCGVPLQTVTFENDDFIVETRPNDEQLTFRQVISWVAQMGGQWCRCDSYGRLCISWYNLENYEAEELDESKFHVFSSNNSTSVNNEDVVITGVQVTEYIENESSENKTETYIYGNSGYILSISGNKLITLGKGEEISAIIGKRLVGMQFRPFSVSTMNTPAVEAGDICIVVDRKGNRYKSFVTTHTFQPGNVQSVSCNSKSAVRNSSKQYSLISQMEVANRRRVSTERGLREESLKALAKRISESPGVYTTEESNPDGGRIYYLHNKPTLEESDIIWKMTAEAWGVSTDGGKTWNGGMTVDGDTITRILTATGVNANWVNSGQLSVKNEEGYETFFVDCDTGVVRIKAQEFSLVGGKTIEQIAAEKVKDFVDQTYTPQQEYIQGLLDRKIETWYQAEDPSLEWFGWRDAVGDRIKDINGKDILLIDESIKRKHEGDLWKNSTTNAEYIYRDGKWEKTFVADEVFNEINGKAQIFVSTPRPPYRKGDLWFNDDKSDIITCIKTRETGEYDSSDWKKLNKYTDDSKVEDFIKNTYTPVVEKFQSQIDGKIDTYYYDYEPSLDNIPASEWTEKDYIVHNGDLFFWKSMGYTYRFFEVEKGKWNWVQVKDKDIDRAMIAASKAQDTADNKRRVFVDEPLPPYDIGDLWANGEELKRCAVKRFDGGSYDETDWIPATSYTDDSKAQEALDAIKDVQRLTITLSNEYHPISTDADGKTQTTVMRIPSTMTVYFGNKDVTNDNNTTCTAVPSSGVYGSWNDSSKTYTVNSLSVDTGYVEFRATYNNEGEFLKATKRFTIVKIKQGKDYKLVYIDSIDSVIWDSVNNYYVPRNPTLTAYYQTGSSKEMYYGDWVIETTMDGSTWTKIRTDKNTPKTYIDTGYSLSTKPLMVRATLYQVGTNNIYDQKTIQFLASLQTQRDVFNALTDNGKIQGMYMKDNKLYINAEYIVTGILADELKKSYWNLDTGNMQVTGQFDHYTDDGVKSISIVNNQLALFAWDEDGRHVGSLGAIKSEVEGEENVKGVDLLCTKGNTVGLGITSEELNDDGSVKAYAVLRVNSETAEKEPIEIANTVSGKIFSGSPGGGITVKNGLITNYNIGAWSGTIPLGTGYSLKVSNGLIIDCVKS